MTELLGKNVGICGEIEMLYSIISYRIVSRVHPPARMSPRIMSAHKVLRFLGDVGFRISP